MVTSSARRLSPVRQVVATPLYLRATIAVFLSAVGMSAAAPQIALFLVRDLGASLSTAGLFYLTSLLAPVCGYLVGSWSDRTGGRLGLFRLCAVLGFLGWAGIAASTQVWMPFVCSALLLGFAVASGSQLFAAIHDELLRRPESGGDGVVAVARMSLTAGWVVGPVAGAALAAQIGLRPMLMATAFCLLAQIVPLGLMRTPSPGSPSAPPPSAVAASVEDAARRPSLATMAPLLVFTGLYVLVYSGESVKYGYLPIYMNEQLRLPAAVGGAVIGIQPLVELLIMPFSVVLARRLGSLPLMAAGALLGVGANLCFALTGSAAGLFAGQILMGGVWGIFAVLGIIVAQRLLPTAVATASGIFMSSTAIGSAMGGLIGGIGSSVIGLPLVFLLPALCGLLAATGLAIMARTTRLERSP